MQSNFTAVERSSTTTVRLYARIGHALIEAHTTGTDAFAAIESVVSWDRFESSVAEAQALAQPDDFDYLSLLDERYGSVRKFAPLLLAEFEFHATPAADDLMRALDVLRELNSTGKRRGSGQRAYRVRGAPLAAVCFCVSNHVNLPP